jgi:hypothetical protein
MFRARAWSGLLLLAALVFLMGGRQVPLTDPEPIAVPAGLRVEQVAKAIKAALVGRWIQNLVNDMSRNLTLVQS